MAFCCNCGTNLNDAAFCPNCGTPAGQTIAVVGNTSVIQGTPKNERAMALELLDGVIMHYSDVEEDYKLFVKDSEEIDRRKKMRTLSYLLAAPVIWIVGLIVLLVTPLNNITILGLIYLFLLLVLPIVLPIYAKIKNVKALKRLDKETDELVEKMLSHYHSYEGEMPIGFEFYNTDCLYGMRNMLTSGRATNIPQAINLLLDDRHKQIMELRALLTQNAAEAAAAFSMQAAAYSREAAINSREAASNSAEAAFFAEGTYFNSK